MATGVVGPYNAHASQRIQKAIATYADIGVGNVAVILGVNVGNYRKAEIKNAINRCKLALIEDGYKKPVIAGTYREAVIDIGLVGGLSIQDVAGTNPAEENGVAVAYESTFDNNPASSLNLSVTVDKLLNDLIKETLRAA